MIRHRSLVRATGTTARLCIPVPTINPSGLPLRARHAQAACVFNPRTGELTAIRRFRDDKLKHCIYSSDGALIFVLMVRVSPRRTGGTML